MDKPGDRRLHRLWCVVVLCCWLMMTDDSCPAATPLPMIFDTDLESDVDDAGTVALLHALVARGEVRVLAMGVSVKHRWSAPCLDALNTFFGHPNIPIGRVTGPGIDSGSKYAETIARDYPTDLKPGVGPDAVGVYRKALATAKDGSVVLVSVGFLTNVANLLRSPADAVSPLNGRQLVDRKVKSWVCMGGRFPKGREWNVHRDTRSSRYALQHWPTRIVFSGYEIGVEIKTGAGLKQLPVRHPVRRCYQLYNGLKNRSSWDQTATLYAVQGLDGGLKGLWDLSGPGRIVVNPDGSNTWQKNPRGRHVYLVRKQNPATIAVRLERLMLFEP